ncbi:kinase-like domain-containing protein [Roridomyces roridus]|uniref:non-specific serine/threonine protein kinase n=1 Tax=Roridomyces roridus TaxID=1738132 RepID=A0AAD7BEF4_9AGAR|nr:kinase-like domain-containing protein [Roridomyces roridus]
MAVSLMFGTARTWGPRSSPGHRGAALKFIASDQTGKTLEAEINNFLALRSREEPGFHNVALCLETFQVNGPNGIHDVIASEPALPISSLFYNNVIEHLDDRIIFQQTLSGVGFLHKHGIVHRDLHLGNIAVEFPFLRTAGVAAILKGTGLPVCHAILPTAPSAEPSSLPIYGVEKAKFCRDLLPSMISEAQFFVVKIIDFGCSFRPAMDDTPNAIGGFLYNPPECNLSKMIAGRNRRLHSPRDLSDLVWSAQGDIWIVACTLFSILDRDQNHIFRGAAVGAQAFFRTVAKYLGPVP